MDNLYLGVDIGGTHITAALVNVASGVVLEHTVVRHTVDPEDAAGEIINAWAAVIKQVTAFSKESKQLLIGIAMPGPFDYEKGISLIKEQKKFRSLFGLNVKKMLAAKLGMEAAQIHFLNDACSFLCGELLGGAVKGEKMAIGITLGTGLGSALYFDESCADAALWDVRFKDGIAEDYLSTRWFTSEFFKRYDIEVKGVKEMLPFIAKDKSKAAIFEEFGNNLALFLLQVVKKTGCSTIVLGGNISRTAPYFLESLQQQFKLADVVPDIRLSEIGESAVLIGAAGEAHNKLSKKWKTIA